MARFLSVFDLFKVGIGPSSSHTVGPMRAARLFVESLRETGLSAETHGLHVTLYGSLAATGHGHATPGAVILGLMGMEPRTIDPDRMAGLLRDVSESKSLALGGGPGIAFDEARDISWQTAECLPGHPNAVRFAALDAEGEILFQQDWYSVGGGFVVERGDFERGFEEHELSTPPYPFVTGDELLAICEQNGMSVSQVMLANECEWRSEEEVREQLLAIWAVMQACVERGCESGGLLPGGLNVRRRASALFTKLRERAISDNSDPLTALDWVSLWALAVNEENAAGGRVVTAPTNGAAGIVPAVLHFYMRFVPGADEDGIVRFLLAAGAVCILCKLNASISGAEVGCQGEVGSACAMAAAGLAEVLDGTPLQVENAAEIGMEHNLGLTCDPIGGLVQIPCIERNAMAAVKAIHAARMALKGDGTHHVSLDQVIETMRTTGRDMMDKYKETSTGGLAVNWTEC